MWQPNELKKIKMVALDMDGVLTNSLVYLPDSGEMFRSMNTRDGYAMQLAVKKGLKLVIISGGTSRGAQARLRYLGIEEAHLGVKNKLALLKEILEKHRVKPEETLFMGDDVPDLECMLYCGFNACPADAVPDVTGRAAHITHKAGGDGCVREVLEEILKAQGKWPEFSNIQSK